MKLRRLTLGLLGAAQLFASTASAQEEAAGPSGPFDVANFSMTIWGTTEYMFRGVSNSDGPAIQASIDWTYNNFYLGVWGSNTEFSDEDIEIDFYGGYRWSWFGWGFDAAGLYYAFPGEDDAEVDASSPLDPGLGPLFGGQDADYIEAQLLLSKTFELTWSPSVAFKYDYSPDFFGEDGEAHAVQGDLGVVVPLGFLGDVGFSGSVGYQTVEGDHSSGCDNPLTNPPAGSPGSQPCFFEADGVTVVDGYDYVWWRVGAYKDIGGFKVDISYHATDLSEDLKAFYGFTPPRNSAEPEFRDLVDPHIVLTVSRSFSFP